MALLAVAGCSKKDTLEAEGLALEAANSWLEFIDRGEYAAGWQAAALYFRDASTQIGWEQQIGAIRGAVGAVASRELRSSEYKKNPPGMREGVYVVLQYDTVFENVESSVETVVPMLDPDGIWRVSAYYLK